MENFDPSLRSSEPLKNVKEKEVETESGNSLPLFSSVVQPRRSSGPLQLFQGRRSSGGSSLQRRASSVAWSVFGSSSSQPDVDSLFKSAFTTILKRGAPRDFNQAIDKLKNADNWKSELKSKVEAFSKSELEALAKVRPLELRAFDREALQHIFIAAEGAASYQDLKDIFKELANDHDVKIIDTTKKKACGSGAVNTVYLVKYDDQKGMSKEGVFKPDPAELPVKTKVIQQHFGTGPAVGIPPGDAGHLPSRAVASSVIDRMLNDDDPISVTTAFAIVDGDRGILMSKAEGQNPETKMVMEIIDISDKERAYISGLMKKGITKKDLNMLAANHKYQSVEIIKNGDGSFRLDGTKRVITEETPYDNALTFEGLLILQIKDIITGECDRHPKNYFIDITGKVTGIDEDCCFGIFAIPRDVDVRSQPALKKIVPNNSSLMLRMPAVVSQKIKARVEGLWNQRNSMEKKLEKFITNDEIKETLYRLRKLLDHINSDLCKVVEDDQLYKEGKEKAHSNNNYWARDLMRYDSAAKGWYHLRVHEGDLYVI